MTTAALWLRVSTGEQDLSNQLPALEALADRRGWQVVKTYQLAGESAFSTSSGYRQALTAMLEDARRGRFQILALWSLDRLSRSGVLDTLQLLDRLGRAGVTVVSTQESWTEVDGPLRELMTSVMAWIAKQESVRRSQRTLAGLERARAAGVRLGRPPGSRDWHQRRRSGYFARWAKEREQ